MKPSILQNLKTPLAEEMRVNKFMIVGVLFLASWSERDPRWSGPTVYLVLLIFCTAPLEGTRAAWRKKLINGIRAVGLPLLWIGFFCSIASHLQLIDNLKSYFQR